MITKITSSVKLVLLFLMVSGSIFAQTKQPATKSLVTYYDSKKTIVYEKTNVLVSNPTILHGSYKKYGKNSVVIEEGNYNNGKQIGVWRYRNESDGLEYKTENYNNAGELNGEVVEKSGKSKSIKHYKNGKPDGSQKAWNEAGILVKDFNYRDGLQHGKQAEYHYATGKLLAEGSYDMGKKVGTWKFYYDDGKLKEESTYDSDGNVKTILYELDGTPTNPGEKRIYYNQAGSVCEKKDAFRYRIIMDDSTKKSYGVYEKKGIGYYMTGEKFWEAKFPELNQNQIKFWGGEERYYYKNGKIKSEGTYERGERKGDWKYYDKDGNLESRGSKYSDEGFKE